MQRYSDHPAIAVWDTTAQASSSPPLGELATSDVGRLLRQLASAAVPQVVFAGNAPETRPDLVDLVTYGRALDLDTSVTFGPMPVVTPGLVRRLARSGLSRLVASIHGQGAVTHEAFVGIAGSFDGSLRMLADARRLGIPTQLDTTLHAGNVRQLGRIAELVELVGASVWEVSYLVPSGPGQERLLPSQEAVTHSLDELREIAETRPFKVRTSGAPNYPRHVAQRAKDAPAHTEHEIERQDERGFVFVDSAGDIYPHRQLPVRCGNVKTDSLLDVYRSHMVFRLLHTADMLGGKCRACNYRHVCSGSRARAYATSHSLTAQDPLCAYLPPDYESAGEESNAL